MIKIDINCDLGEGIGNESAVMPYISSCNIACGGHAGDLKTMETVVDLAHYYSVNIGAHPSFPDKEGFGRTVLELSSEELTASIYQQINNLKMVLDSKKLKLHHIKPHGALYNLAAVDVTTAKIVIEVVKRFGSSVILYAPYQSVMAEMAIKNGVRVCFEAFADRNYNDDLTLVSRSEKNAVIHDTDEMFKHVYNMIFNGYVTALNGVEVKLKAETLCIHGDHENVVHYLKNLIAKFEQFNMKIS